MPPHQRGERVLVSRRREPLQQPAIGRLDRPARYAPQVTEDRPQL
jgi:hypothetical protein